MLWLLTSSDKTQFCPKDFSQKCSPFDGPARLVEPIDPA
jgi:hypothetical protein